jgi:siderophore synthetase component
MTQAQATSPDTAIAHLAPEHWQAANAAMVRKIISEFAHERLLAPQPVSDDGQWTTYGLVSDDGATRYRFRAKLLSLEHWHIEPGSIVRYTNEGTAELDAVAFIAEFQTRLAIDTARLPVYLEEITSTLYSAAYKRADHRPGAAELVYADFQTIEAAMTEGHPSFIANSGRIGFDALEYRAYAPETAASVQLIWVAAHSSRATFTSIDDQDNRDLIAAELGSNALETFDAVLRERGLDPAAYCYMPVHPWQWYNKISGIFAGDIAAGRLVCLGTGAHVYQPQQSIRTFFNRSTPSSHYVKTALSILNMGFMRGLSPYYMGTTPAINAWLQDLIDNDAYLQETGFGILREVATIGYRNTAYEQAVSGNSPYKKMLAALWRESPIAGLQPGQRVMTMAALLHIDYEDEALLPELIRASGLPTEDWLRRYLSCYLKPLLHCFYAHDLVFMPHGENLILVLEDHVPVRAIMKDVAEEIGVMNDGSNLPASARRVAIDVPDDLRALSIFTDVFDSIFRYLAVILSEYVGYPQADFWALVAECIHGYQRANPQFAERFRADDLFAPRFTLSCLNRLQLRDNEQLIDLADPTSTLQFAGTLTNPLTDAEAAGEHAAMASA